MIDKKYENLISKYFSKSINKVELDELSLWLQKEANAKEFKEYVKVNYLVDYNLMDFNSKVEINKVLHHIRKQKRGKLISLYYKYAAVAAVLVFTISFFFMKENNNVSNQPAVVNNSVKIGKDKAILTLEDGSAVALEKGVNYVNEDAVSNGKELVYSKNEKAEIAYNYLTVPRGGEFFVELADGTKVWLNSDSKLKYPTSFENGKVRKVELVYGEAYFDVSPSTEHKGATFKVISKLQEIEVLGTEFNVKAYADETKTYTTLAEGSIELKFNNQKKVLKPTQQAVVSNGANKIRVQTVNVYEEVSWRDGIFSFRGKSLEHIMKVLSRWYDVTVTFENKKLKSTTFKGVLSKQQTIDEILSAIKSASVINSYEINGNTIVLK